jgi:hypothetical protein
MSTAIVRHDPTIASLDDVQRVAKLLATSNYFDAKAAQGDLAIAQIATKILAGREMGYGPFASVQGIHVIQGKPVISANLMAAAVKRSGRYDYRVRRLDNDGCEVEFFQRNGDKMESVGKSAFTKEDAKAAKLLEKDNWGKFARNMFFARALSNGIRWFCPDVFDGSAAYTPDELGIDEDADGNVITVQAHVIQEATPNRTPPAAANHAPATGNASTNGGAAGNGSAQTPVIVDARTLRHLHAVGGSMYGADWDAKRKEIVKAATKGRTDSSKALSQAEADYLIGRMEARLQEQLAAISVEGASEMDPESLEVPA